MVRPYEIFCEPNANGGQCLKCILTGIQADGRVVAKTRFNQVSTFAGGYKKMTFVEGDVVVIISASVENSYLLFGFKETQSTLKRLVDSVEVEAIESTTIKP